MKYITSVMFGQANSCANQQRLFETTFGSEAELTEANVAKAAEVGLHFEWLVRLLPQTALEAYAVKHEPLYEAFATQRVFLQEVYEASRAPLLEAYNTQEALLRRAYEEQLNTLLINTLLAA